MKLDLGLDEVSLAKARRREFPELLRTIVEQGYTMIELDIDAVTALSLADDIERAIAADEISSPSGAAVTS